MKNVVPLISLLFSVAALALGVVVPQALADAGDEYTEFVPEAGGKKPSQDVRGGDPGSTQGSASSPSGDAQSSSSSGLFSGSKSGSDNREPSEAESIARATAPDSPALRRAILERKGADEDEIEAQLAESAGFADEAYLGGSGGIGLAFPLVLGLSLLATLFLLWRRRSG
jgi:hypothetical protein